MKHYRFFAGLAVVAVLLLSAGCAPEGHSLKEIAEISGQKVPGFWLGLWHGAIFPITFIISLFNESVGVYEVVNSGKLYNFGFLLGLFGSIGGMAKNSVRSRDKSR